jgi:hypothetical protein
MVTQPYNDLFLHKDGRPHRHSKSLFYYAFNENHCLIFSRGLELCTKFIYFASELFFLACIPAPPLFIFSCPMKASFQRLSQGIDFNQ